MSGFTGTTLSPPLFPPSGIPRNYGVNFFIYVSNVYPVVMAAVTTPFTPTNPYAFVVNPSPGLMNYFDYILGGAPFISNALDDCLSEAFCADNTGSGGAMMLPG